LLALKAGFAETGRWITVGDVYTSHKVVVHHVCDGVGVEMTEVVVLEVK